MRPIFNEMVYFTLVNSFIHFWMLEVSFLSFEKAEVQFSMGFSPHKLPKPYQNSRKAEILCIDSTEYVFKILEFLRNPCTFWPLHRRGGGGGNFDFWEKLFK